MSLYISNSGIDSNVNDGSLSKPFNTLSYAISNITSQNSIIFLKGTYQIPTTDINIDGITIKSISGERAIIDGTKNINQLKNTNSNWTKINHTVSTENGDSTINSNIYKRVNVRFIFNIISSTSFHKKGPFHSLKAQLFSRFYIVNDC